LVRKRGRIISVGAHSAETWPFPLARSFANELTLGFAIASFRSSPRVLSIQQWSSIVRSGLRPLPRRMQTLRPSGS
jgi:hypothetical protein